MKLIMLSTDGNIFKEGSEARSRMLEYGKLVEELHIIVLAAQNPKSPARLASQSEAGRQIPNPKQIINSKFQISRNTFVYSAFSVFKLFCLLKAYKMSSSIIKNLKFETPQESKHPTGQVKNCVVTTQDPFETGLIGYFLKKKFNVPLQIQIHTDFLSPYFWGESLINKIRVLIAKRIIPSANGFRVVSERIKNSLITYLPNILTSKISVLPLFYDMGRFTNGVPSFDLRGKYPGRDFIILSASRLSTEKNIFMAIKAMKKVVEKRPKTLLLIVGSGPELDDLKSQVTSYKLQDNVVFESWTKDIISYYKTADMFVLTSNYEGGARAPVEAISSGLPVVMTDVPPAGELVIDGLNGFVVDVGNADKLSEKIMELISDKREYLKFRENSLKMAEGFITKETYFKLYYKALADALVSANS